MFAGYVMCFVYFVFNAVYHKLANKDAVARHQLLLLGINNTLELLKGAGNHQVLRMDANSNRTCEQKRAYEVAHQPLERDRDGS